MSVFDPLPVAQMGHNWVLAKTADWHAVAQAGQAAGPETDYLPKDDERIIAMHRHGWRP